MKRTELFFDDMEVNTMEFRYYYHTESLHTFSDELPVLLPIGNKHLMTIDGEKMLFECVEYTLVQNGDEQIIGVVCHQIKNDIDLTSLIRDIKINQVLPE